MNWFQKNPHNKISHLYYFLFVAKKSGFKAKKPDHRNFTTKDLGWFGAYVPQHTRHEIKTLSVKNQAPNNTCTIEAGTVQKEVDEGVVLSVGSAVTKQKRLGLLSGNGWASLDGIQKVLKDWGIMEEKDAPTKRDWYSLSNTPINDEKAAVHKTKSYWEVNSRDAKLRALDEGKVITTAVDWFTGYNATYLNNKYLIDKRSGYKVGGHSINIVGYDFDYFGQKVYIMQNSYGEGWGDNGKFYFTMDFLDKESFWGAYVNMDIEYQKALNSDDIIAQYDLKNVRGNLKPAIYLIYAGKKMAYKNAEAYVAYNGVPYTYKNSFTVVPQAELDKIPMPSDGGLLTLESGNGRHSDLVKNLKKPVNDSFKPE